MQKSVECRVSVSALSSIQCFDTVDWATETIRKIHNHLMATMQIDLLAVSPD